MCRLQNNKRRQTQLKGAASLFIQMRFKEGQFVHAVVRGIDGGLDRTVYC